MSLDLGKYEWILKRLPRPMLQWLEGRLKQNPKTLALIQKEEEKVEQLLEHSLKPYRNRFERRFQLPRQAVQKEDILNELKKMNELETPRWKEGYVSGGIYHGDAAHISFLNEVYALQSQSNPLHMDLFPSATKFEAEIVSMVRSLLCEEGHPQSHRITGTVSSGGTESILLAMKTYRDWGLKFKGIKKPEIIAPMTAHVAFDKAAHYFGLSLIKIPVDQTYRVDVAQVKRAITSRTVALVGSAPSFPHGVIDPISELSALAVQANVGLHVDACLGGFILPFARKLGVAVPEFDFRLPGVTSISVDTHKYGYAAKGTSVVLYRNEEFQHEQYFTATEWPGGLYFSPTLAGSRPGALSAACWASLLAMGEDGYLRSTRAILEAADRIKQGIREIPELKILGEPLWIIAFGSDDLNIYQLLDGLSQKGWSLNGLHHPPCIHIALTLRHTEAGVVERFLEDLKDSVAQVRSGSVSQGGMAPVYGMASSLPFRGMISDLLKKTLDVIYRV
ncbi:MAG: aminotransferase class V-fold PLP-dependent enzyme [Bdellovibrionia bacterium]